MKTLCLLTTILVFAVSSFSQVGEEIGPGFALRKEVKLGLDEPLYTFFWQNNKEIYFSENLSSTFVGGRVVEAKSRIHIHGVLETFGSSGSTSLRNVDLWLLLCQGKSLAIQRRKDGKLLKMEVPKIVVYSECDSLMKTDWTKVVSSVNSVLFKNRTENSSYIFSAKNLMLTLEDSIALQASYYSKNETANYSSLHIYRKFFDIQFESKTEDLENTLLAFDAFCGEDLAWWNDSVHSLIDEIAANNKNNTRFEKGRAMYLKEVIRYDTKVQHMAGKAAYLFPFVKHDSTNLYVQTNYKKGTELKKKGIKKAAFPNGISIIPFTLVTKNKTYEMEVVTGFVGATTYFIRKEDIYYDRPIIGWAIREREE